MPRRHTYTHGKQAFLDFYSRLLPDLDVAALLSARHSPVLLPSPSHLPQLRSLFSHTGLSWKPLPWFPAALFWPPQVPPGTPLPGYSQGWLYSLNPASLLPALALRPQPGELILDACAAPGGKTLALHLLCPQAIIHANDLSLPRFKRLRTVLRHFDLSHIFTHHLPAQKLASLHLRFDKILLDAPCSSEKHVFNSKRHLALWSPKRVSALAHQQTHLLSALVPLLKPGGQLVYSTCALAPQENEAVVAHATTRLGLTLSSLPPGLPLSSPGLPGFGLEPAACQNVLRVNVNPLGLDPMFVAILSR